MKYTLYIFALLLLGTVLNLYLINRKQNDSLEVLSINQQSILKQNAFLKAHFDNRKLEVKMNGIALPKDLFVYKEMDSLKVKEIVNGYKLIMRFSELDCDQCVDSALLMLKGASEKIGGSNIALFVKKYNPRYITQFKRINDVKYPIYELSAKSESFVPEIGRPYFFIIDSKTLRMNSVYIPEKEEAKSTEDYLRNLTIKYFP